MTVIIATVITGGLTTLIVSRSHNEQQLNASQTSSEVSQKLSSDPDFIASVQSKLNQAIPPSSAKGDKGDKGDTGPAGNSGSPGVAGISGASGENGVSGTTGITGAQGPKGDTGAPGTDGADGAKGDKGDTGAQGPQGIQGPQGAQGQQGIQGETGVVSVSATGLSYNSSTKDIALSSGYGIPLLTSQANWSTAYSWGNHATAGYTVLAGKSGGQQLVGGVAANEVLTLQANAATSGNTATNVGISLKVGNSGATTALAVLNNGNVGIGTTAPGSKLTLSGDFAITTTGTDAIKPIQFVQVTGLGDDAKVTSFNSANYSTTDWNAALVGFSTGGGCGTNWTNAGSLAGFKYWWDNNAGNWRLNVDINGPNDGCNSVQVMFTRKEVSNRANYGF